MAAAVPVFFEGGTVMGKPDCYKSYLAVEGDFYKRFYEDGGFVLFPQKQDVERRDFCSDYEDRTFQIPLYAAYWCESVRRDLNWCRHTNFPYASVELILDGRIEHVSGGRRSEAAAGDLLVFAPGQDRWYIQREKTHKIFIIIDGSVFKLLMNELGFRQDTLIRLESPEETEKLFRAIRGEMELHSDAGRCRGSGLLWSLLLDLSRQFRKSADAKVPVEIRNKNTLLKKRNMPCRKNDEIADVFKVSKRSLYNIFRKYYDETPHRWQRRQQLERAAILLRTSGKTVAETAAECGFRNPKYFMTLFRKVYGVTPGEWRRSQDNAPPLPPGADSEP